MKAVKQPTIRRRLSLRRWVPFAVLALGGTLTAFMVISLSLTEEVRARAAFESDTLETWQNVNSGLERLIEVARVATALLAVSQEINYVEFRSFVRGLQLRERYPAIDGIGFSQRIGRQDLRTFLRQVHLDGVSDLDVWPAGPRSEYHTILFLEPGDERNASALGFDMATSATLLAAMERARDSGAPAILRSAADFRSDLSQAQVNRPAPSSTCRSIVPGGSYGPSRTGEKLSSGSCSAHSGPKCRFSRASLQRHRRWPSMYMTPRWTLGSCCIGPRLAMGSLDSTPRTPFKSLGAGGYSMQDRANHLQDLFHSRRRELSWPERCYRSCSSRSCGPRFVRGRRRPVTGRNCARRTVQKISSWQRCLTSYAPP